MTFMEMVEVHANRGCSSFLTFLKIMNQFKVSHSSLTLTFKEPPAQLSTFCLTYFNLLTFYINVKVRHKLDAVILTSSHGSFYFQVENQIGTYDPNGYIVVYAVDDAESLREAERILTYLKSEGIITDHAVILVANKTDLVRSRVVSSNG